jgi:hypothetical protein
MLFLEEVCLRLRDSWDAPYYQTIPAEEVLAEGANFGNTPASLLSGSDPQTVTTHPQWMGHANHYREIEAKSNKIIDC